MAAFDGQGNPYLRIDDHIGPSDIGRAPDPTSTLASAYAMIWPVRGDVYEPHSCVRGCTHVRRCVTLSLRRDARRAWRIIFISLQTTVSPPER